MDSGLLENFEKQYNTELQLQMTDKTVPEWSLMLSVSRCNDGIDHRIVEMCIVAK